MYNLIVGIDISKTTIDASITRKGEKVVNHDSFLNKLFGFKQLVKWIMKFEKEGDMVLVCMEHTGYYGQKLSEYLKGEKIDISQINPLKIKMSLGFRREKSDKSDSKAIAMYGLKFQDEMDINNLTDGVFLDLQLLLAHRRRLQDKMLDFQRQEKHLKDCMTSSYAKQIIRNLRLNRKHLKKQFVQAEDHLEDYVHKYPELEKNYHLLMSIPGVGNMIALHTLMYTHNFERISCPRKFACYCGVAPFKNESGTSVRKGTRTSFYANKIMKSILVFGAMNAVKWDPELKAYYQRKVEEKNNKMLVLNAVKNKLIHRMYAVVRRGSPFVVKTFV